MALSSRKNFKYLITLFASLTLLLFYFSKKTSSSNLPLIAITQIIDHHTLDEVRQGMIEILASHGYEEGKTVTLLYENANGNISVANEIAKKFQTLKPSVIIALSTQSAQTLLPLAQADNIPLIFTAVTDPLAAKLVTAYDKTDKGVTGISDYMPAKPQLEMIKHFIPHLKKIGFLYNPAEINSVSILKEMEEAAKAEGIDFVYAPANNTSEVVAATKSLLKKVDAIYFPNDNTIMAAAAAVAKTAQQENTPVFANDSASVTQGVLAAVAYDRKAMGAKTAEIVIGILQGKKTAEFPVTHDVAYEVVVNKVTLELLKMPIPDNYQSKVRLIQ